jgi:DNA-binding transcriptional ArsR family regulator
MDSASELDAIFFALSDSTRRSLLARLLESDATAGTLAAGFDISRPAVSQHLRVLRAAELVVEERRGRERHYTLLPQKLALIGEWLDAYRVFWPARLHDLKDLVESMPDEPRRSRPRSRKTTR